MKNQDNSRESDQTPVIGSPNMKVNYKKLSLESEVFHPFYGKGKVKQIGVDYSVVVQFHDYLKNEYQRKFRYELVSSTEHNSIHELFMVPVKVVADA